MKPLLDLMLLGTYLADTYDAVCSWIILLEINSNSFYGSGLRT